MVLRKPALSFHQFVEERDRCRDASYRSPHWVLRHGFFENTDRTWDHVSEELRRALARPGPREARVATVILLRMSGSPRESERPRRSGATVIWSHCAAAFAGGAHQAALERLQSYVRAMPFTGRKTYRAVLSREVLASTVAASATRLAAALDEPQRDFFALRDTVLHALLLGSSSRRRPAFASLQIAFDLHSYGMARVADVSDCPLAVGSRRGLGHVRRWEDRRACVVSLAACMGREAPSAQTALCAYDKYVRWSARAAVGRLRFPSTAPRRPAAMPPCQSHEDVRGGSATSPPLLPRPSTFPSSPLAALPRGPSEMSGGW